MKILIAEDDLINRMMMQEFLQMYGTLHLAVNGKEAVDAVCAALVSGDPYDLICLDIMMPVMDGQAALKQIRDLEEARGVTSTYGSKIIMTTALDDVKSSISAFKSLCDGYLVKPIDKAKLLDTLRKLQLVQ